VHRRIPCGNSRTLWTAAQEVDEGIRSFYALFNRSPPDSRSDVHAVDPHLLLEALQGARERKSAFLITPASNK